MPKRIAKILLVDDRPENLLSLEMLIQAEGREIIKAHSGNEALKLALKNDFALILTDVQMPEMNGFEMVELMRLNNTLQMVPIIFVTASNRDEADVIKGMEYGAIDYLYKPLNPVITQKKVDSFVEMYHYKMALEDTNNELLKANENLDRFAYIVSHDLKAPIRGIAQLAEFIQEDFEEEMGEKIPESVKSHIGLINSRVRRMEAMIEGILTYSRVGRKVIALSTVNVQDLLEDIIDINLLASSKFKVVIGPDMPTIETERTMLQQVFSNLISNAQKYNDKKEGKVEITVADQGSFFEFTVKDNGPGIDPKFHERVFRLFDTLNRKENYESTGIGLAIVKEIVEGQGGAIRLESEVGEGAAFIFTWPKKGQM